MFMEIFDSYQDEAEMIGATNKHVSRRTFVEAEGTYFSDQSWSAMHEHTGKSCLFQESIFWRIF